MTKYWFENFVKDVGSAIFLLGKDSLGPTGFLAVGEIVR